MLEALQNLENDDRKSMPPSAWQLVQEAIKAAGGAPKPITTPVTPKSGFECLLDQAAILDADSWIYESNFPDFPTVTLCNEDGSLCHVLIECSSEDSGALAFAVDVVRRFGRGELTSEPNLKAMHDELRELYASQRKQILAMKGGE
ncbi:hypothetical protein ACQU0X_23930 [Pseudovibrio ascidiaceicola]|uniref:hypothetical protein n=1 Tax=Pseudovibrio ascidiaceicola TaxID=285279 RepID=UPI003D35A38C